MHLMSSAFLIKTKYNVSHLEIMKHQLSDMYQLSGVYRHHCENDIRGHKSRRRIPHTLLNHVRLQLLISEPTTHHWEPPLLIVGLARHS